MSDESFWIVPGCVALIALVMTVCYNFGFNSGQKEIRLEAYKLNFAEYKIGPDLSLEFSWKTNLVK
jgi:hypothetical protein